MSGNGSRNRFNTDNIKEIRKTIKAGLNGDNIVFEPNPNIENTFRVIINTGKKVGARGETNIRVIVGNDGKVINAFPVKIR